MRLPGNNINYGRSPRTHPTYGQAHHVAGLFGGEFHLSKLLGLSHTSVYRWSHTPNRSGGCDGLIPNIWRAKIEAIARENGVLLTPADWSPRPINYEPKKRKNSK